METIEELRKWVESLSVAEKRFITLIGKARAGAGSQQLELFDWLNQAAPSGALPASARFRQNLPTVSNRLKDLILDGLRLLHKEDDTGALLHTTLDEISLLFRKKLHRPAARQLKRAKKLALQTARYGYALQCIEWEQRLALLQPGDARETLRKLRDEETEILARQEVLRDLQHRHAMMLALVKQVPFHREEKTLREVHALVECENVHREAVSGAYLERTLAVNLLGTGDLFGRKPLAARERYQALLRDWQANPAWQTDQPQLLLSVCKFYQAACFFSRIDWQDARHYIAKVSDFKGLPPDAGRDFQRMLYHNQFTLALNTGNFDSVRTLIPEIDAWLERENEHLLEGQVLPFFCNFAVAEFLQENMTAANRVVGRILNTPNRKIRVDIREFALVLQSVLQYELGNESLQEHLTRAAKRHFKKTTADQNFELIILKHLEELVHAGSAADKEKALQRLIKKLDALVAPAENMIPLLGLNEVRMWAESKRRKLPLREIFLEEVRKNLEALGQTDLLEAGG